MTTRCFSFETVLQELRSWFRRMEAELFRARFEASSPDKQDAFLEAHSFKHVEVQSLRRSCNELGRVLMWASATLTK